MNAPEEAFEQTVLYIRICGGGVLVIIAYNLIGSIFRGIGDSATPLITVAIACVFNIAGDHRCVLCACPGILPHESVGTGIPVLYRTCNPHVYDHPVPSLCRCPGLRQSQILGI